MINVKYFAFEVVSWVALGLVLGANGVDITSTPISMILIWLSVMGIISAVRMQAREEYK